MENRREFLKEKTEIVFVLDCSGSMAGMEGDTVGGFNALLKKQKKKPGHAWVSTVLFNGESRVLHDRLPLPAVPFMRPEDFQVGGCTALMDALGGAVRHIERVHRYIRREDVPGHTLFVIMTDGMENASRRYTQPQVRAMIEKKQAEGWEFLFLGANIDSAATAVSYGIREDRAVDYHCDAAGTQLNFKVVEQAVTCVRENSPLSADWSDEIRRDHRSRRPMR
ncbi:MAG: hypothetical protein ACI4LH_03825 [Candidatus Heritagella sp.]